jgi:gliding motility-associated-like protein
MGVTLNLTILNAANTIDIQTSCTNYTWIDGITYTSSTNTPTFIVPGGAANGCDSIINLNLTINNSNNIIVTAQICSGQNYSLLDGSIVNVTGLYPITLINSLGCDSIINTDLLVIPSQTISLNPQICAGQTYLLPDGSTTNITGLYIDTLTSVTGCDSILNINLQVLPTLNNTVNAQICSGQSYLLPDGSTTSNAGTYNFNLLGTGGCDSIVQINLNVLSLSFDTINGLVCNAQPYGLPDGTIVNAPGIYDIFYTNQVGCDSIVTTVLTNGANLTATVQIASSPAGPICFGTPVTFTAGSINGGTAPLYQWYINGIAVNGQTSNEFTSNSLNDSDLVSVQLTSNEPCVSNTLAVSNVILQEVTIPLITTVSIITSQQFPACTGFPITFTSFTVNGGANPTYQWFINGVAILGATNDTLIIDSLENNDVVSLNEYSDLDCVTNSVAYSNPVTVTLIESITPSIFITSNDTIICAQQLVTFTAHADGAGASAVLYYWFVNNSIVAVGPDTVFTYNNFTNQDIVTCQLVSSYICVNPPLILSNPIRVTVNANPVVDMINYQYNNNICDSLQLITSTNISDPIFNWSASAYLSCNNCIAPYTIATLDTTWYFVTVADPTTGCFNIDSTIVYLNPEPDIFIPSAFSPNGDNNNDVLYLRGNCIKDVSFKIYDSWGEVVFKSHSMSFGWDGNFKGQEVAADVYVYTLDYVLYNDKKKQAKGNITIIR